MVRNGTLSSLWLITLLFYRGVK